MVTHDALCGEVPDRAASVLEPRGRHNQCDRPEDCTRVDDSSDVGRRAGVGWCVAHLSVLLEFEPDSIVVANKAWGWRRDRHRSARKDHQCGAGGRRQCPTAMVFLLSANHVNVLL